MKRAYLRATAIAAALSFATGAYAADEVRIMWYSDGNEGEVVADLLKKFEEQNPDIKVTLDNVSYQVIKEQLPITLEAGDGPDIARVTDLKALADHWLDLTPYLADKAYWDANYGEQADWMRPDGSQAITGFMTQITLTGAFANKTLFDQAGVALPAAGSTWDQWVEAAAQVAQSQQSPAAFAMDRSGHRMSAPILNYGANYIGQDGMPAPVDAGAKAFLTELVGWTEGGQNLKDVWVSAAGASYRAAAEDFINAQIPLYFSGSWQISNFSTKIGDTFDWVAVGNPCGPDGCSGIPGGAGLVAVKYTKNPEAVGKVMDYLASEPVMREFTQRSLFIPSNAAIRAAGDLKYETADPQVQPALDAFNADVKNLSPEANALPGWKWASAYYTALVTRTGQAMAGEMSLDDAFARMDSDIAEQVAQAAQ